MEEKLSIMTRLRSISEVFWLTIDWFKLKLIINTINGIKRF